MRIKFSDALQLEDQVITSVIFREISQVIHYTKAKLLNQEYLKTVSFLPTQIRKTVLFCEPRMEIKLKMRP